MKYIKKEMDGYNLYFIKTTKFKTIRISLNFGKETSKEDQVYRAILCRVLTKGTSKYPNLDDLCRARMKLYNPSVKVGAEVSGMDRLFYLESSFINEKYTEKDMNKKTIEFVLSYIFNPNVKNGAFAKETFELARHEYIENLKKIKDNPDRYCTERIWEEMDVYPFGEFGIKKTIEFAEKLNERDLYEYYLTLFKENSLDIFVVGDFDEDTMASIFNNIVKGDFVKLGKRRNISRKAKKLKTVTDKMETEQSKLAIGLRYEDLTDFERKYVSLVYNNILGGGWNSKLNKVVREENSLCYYIYASRKIPFGISFIYSGIDAANYDKTVDLIKQQMEEMQSVISDEELQRVKDIYNNALISIEDSQSSILNNVMGQIYTDADDIPERKINMEKVTIDDVKNLAKKVKIEVIYLLEGGKSNGKENL